MQVASGQEGLLAGRAAEPDPLLSAEGGPTEPKNRSSQFPFLRIPESFLNFSTVTQVLQMFGRCGWFVFTKLKFLPDVRLQA